MSDAAPPNEQADGDPAVLIVIVRSGGFAGLRRRWHVEPPHDEAPRWIELIERCPWDGPDPAQSNTAQSDPAQPNSTQPRSDRPGADRFVWSIQARTPAARRERELPESALDGPWRQLVEAVRTAATS